MIRSVQPLGKTGAGGRYRLLTLDLDDTLWPCAPTIERAEERFHAWLAECAPRLAAAHDLDSLRRHRRQLFAERPEIAHDMTALRQVSLELLLPEFGYAPDLAAAGVALFCQHRNQVEPYADVVAVLSQLRDRYHLVSVTNGNAEVALTPLNGFFHRCLTAAEVGAAKPDPAIFEEALRWAGVLPEQALHIGDDPLRDVEAARQCGMAAVWVNRGGVAWPSDLTPPVAEVADLHVLLDWLEEADAF